MEEAVEKYIYGGRYKPLDLVGKGAFSWVAKAFDQKLQRIVCIKVADPLEGMSYDDRVRMFQTEAEIGASLFHPNIVRILDFTFMNETMDSKNLGEPIIVMDYIEGSKLWTFTQKNELTISRVVDIGIQVSRALEYTHQLETPVIHRDIREDNILINKDGHVYLTDWGVSKRGKSLLTTRVAKGTYGFMSPEVMDVELAVRVTDAFKPIDGRADLFSLGVLLYKLITRQLPFKNLSNIVQLREEIRVQNFEKPSAINTLCPSLLEDIVLILLKENPDERYQNASELLEDLNQLIKTVGAAPMHDCQTIVPDILLPKEFIDKSFSQYSEQMETTYIPDAPQTIQPKINPKFQKIAGGVALVCFAFFSYKFFAKSEPQEKSEFVQNVVAKEIKVQSEIKDPSKTTPEDMEKLLTKKKKIALTSSYQGNNGSSVQKLGDSLVVYSKDSDRPGYTSMNKFNIVVGTTFEALIPHKIETSNINSPVRAILTKDVIAKGKVVFPKNSKILGSAVGDQNERIQVRFNRIILPDNREIEFDGSALDENEVLGVKGKMDREKTKRMSASGGRVLGAAAGGAIDAVTGTGIAGQASNTAGQEAVDLTTGDIDARNQAGTVVRLEEKTNIKIFVNRSF